MDIADIIKGITNISTGDYYCKGLIYFVWQGKVVGTWLDCGHDLGRKDISTKWWHWFLHRENTTKGIANGMA